MGDDAGLAEDAPRARERARRARGIKCDHAVCYAVAAEEGGVLRQAAVVCRGCGAMKFCPLVLGLWTGWSPPLARQPEGAFPEGAALRVLAGPSADGPLLKAAAEAAVREARGACG